MACCRNKRKHQEYLENKTRNSLTREQYIRAVQAKATQEREERKEKLSQSKRMVNETRKASAEQRKEESRKLAEYAENGKTYAEIEKKRIADQERRRFVKHFLLAFLLLFFL
jgi:ornithine cyclodeaminase/alanine dehydrogenase-like protein (mu-crystallin family)